MGSFDPVHNGHASIMRFAMNHVQHLYVIPAVKSPWKDSTQLSYAERFLMVSRMAEHVSAGFPGRISVLSSELEHCEESHLTHARTSAHLKYLQSRGFTTSNTILFWGPDIMNVLNNFDYPDRIYGYPNFFVPVTVSVRSTALRELVKAHDWDAIAVGEMLPYPVRKIYERLLRSKGEKCSK